MTGVVLRYKEQLKVLQLVGVMMSGLHNMYLKVGYVGEDGGGRVTVSNLEGT